MQEQRRHHDDDTRGEAPITPLDKIKGILRRTGISSGKDEIRRDLFPGAGRFEEEVQQKFRRWVDRQTPEEILAKAGKVFDDLKKEKNWGKAYHIAQKYLKRNAAKEAATAVVAQKARDVTQKKDAGAAYVILFWEKNCQEAPRTPQMIEEAFSLIQEQGIEQQKEMAYNQVLSFIRIGRFRIAETNKAIFLPVIQERFRALLQKNNTQAALDHLQELGRLEIPIPPEVIEALYHPFVETVRRKKAPSTPGILKQFHPFAREEIRKILTRGNRREALLRAETLEAIGLLSVEEDADLFEQLT